MIKLTGLEPNYLLMASSNSKKIALMDWTLQLKSKKDLSLLKSLPISQSSLQPNHPIYTYLQVLLTIRP